MKIVYIAHPVGGDVPNNIKKIISLVKHISLVFPDVVPFVPFFCDLHALNDDIPRERNVGIKHNYEFFKRQTFDELWLCGDKISTGMHTEIKLAFKFNIPVIPQTTNTSRDFVLYYKNKS